LILNENLRFAKGSYVYSLTDMISFFLNHPTSTDVDSGCQPMKHALLFPLCLMLLAGPLTPSPGGATEPGSIDVKMTFHHYATSDEPPGHLLIVEKALQRLTLFALADGLKPILSLPCATGENHGTKNLSGDRRTPEGVYFITEVFADTKITIFGSRAYRLDYPNIFDLHAGRGGDGIFIHGTNKELTPYSTNGCITLDNLDLDQLAPYLEVRNLPVLVINALGPSNFAIRQLYDPNGEDVRSITDTLDLPPGQLAVENIHSLSFLRIGGQAVASIRYTELDGNSLKYRHHKRNYLATGITRPWRTVHSVQSQETMPSILAVQPVKERLLARVSGPVPPKAGESHAEWERGADPELQIPLD
jgi:hypothetical protein